MNFFNWLLSLYARLQELTDNITRTSTSADGGEASTATPDSGDGFRDIFYLSPKTYWYLIPGAAVGLIWSIKFFRRRWIKQRTDQSSSEPLNSNGNKFRDGDQSLLLVRGVKVVYTHTLGKLLAVPATLIGYALTNQRVSQNVQTDSYSCDLAPSRQVTHTSQTVNSTHRTVTSISPGVSTRRGRAPGPRAIQSTDEDPRSLTQRHLAMEGSHACPGTGISIQPPTSRIRENGEQASLVKNRSPGGKSVNYASEMSASKELPVETEATKYSRTQGTTKGKPGKRSISEENSNKDTSSERIRNNESSATEKDTGLRSTDVYEDTSRHPQNSTQNFKRSPQKKIVDECVQTSAILALGSSDGRAHPKKPNQDLPSQPDYRLSSHQPHVHADTDGDRLPSPQPHRHFYSDEDRHPYSEEDHLSGPQPHCHFYSEEEYEMDAKNQPPLDSSSRIPSATDVLVSDITLEILSYFQDLRHPYCSASGSVFSLNENQLSPAPLPLTAPNSSSLSLTGTPKKRSAFSKIHPRGHLPNKMQSPPRTEDEDSASQNQILLPRQENFRLTHPRMREYKQPLPVQKMTSHVSKRERSATKTKVRKRDTGRRNIPVTSRATDDRFKGDHLRHRQDRRVRRSSEQIDTRQDPVRVFEVCAPEVVSGMSLRSHPKCAKPTFSAESLTNPTTSTLLNDTRAKAQGRDRRKVNDMKDSQEQVRKRPHSLVKTSHIQRGSHESESEQKGPPGGRPQTNTAKRCNREIDVVRYVAEKMKKMPLKQLPIHTSHQKVGAHARIAEKGSSRSLGKVPLCISLKKLDLRENKSLYRATLDKGKPRRCFEAYGTLGNSQEGLIAYEAESSNNETELDALTLEFPTDCPSFRTQVVQEVLRAKALTTFHKHASKTEITPEVVSPVVRRSESIRMVESLLSINDEPPQEDSYRTIMSKRHPVEQQIVSKESLPKSKKSCASSGIKQETSRKIRSPTQGIHGEDLRERKGKGNLRIATRSNFSAIPNHAPKSPPVEWSRVNKLLKSLPKSQSKNVNLEEKLSSPSRRVSSQSGHSNSMFFEKFIRDNKNQIQNTLLLCKSAKTTVYEELNPAKAEGGGLVRASRLRQETSRFPTLTSFLDHIEKENKKSSERLASEIKEGGKQKELEIPTTDFQNLTGAQSRSLLQNVFKNRLEEIKRGSVSSTSLPHFGNGELQLYSASCDSLVGKKKATKQLGSPRTRRSPSDKQGRGGVTRTNLRIQQVPPGRPVASLAGSRKSHEAGRKRQHSGQFLTNVVRSQGPACGLRSNSTLGNPTHLANKPRTPPVKGKHKKPHEMKLSASKVKTAQFKRGISEALFTSPDPMRGSEKKPRKENSESGDLISRLDKSTSDWSFVDDMFGRPPSRDGRVSHRGSVLGGGIKSIHKLDQLSKSVNSCSTEHDTDHSVNPSFSSPQGKRRYTDGGGDKSIMAWSPLRGMSEKLYSLEPILAAPVVSVKRRIVCSPQTKKASSTSRSRSCLIPSRTGPAARDADLSSASRSATASDVHFSSDQTGRQFRHTVAVPLTRSWKSPKEVTRPSSCGTVAVSSPGISTADEHPSFNSKRIRTSPAKSPSTRQGLPPRPTAQLQGLSAKPTDPYIVHTTDRPGRRQTFITESSYGTIPNAEDPALMPETTQNPRALEKLPLSRKASSLRLSPVSYTSKHKASDGLARDSKPSWRETLAFRKRFAYLLQTNKEVRNKFQRLNIHPLGLKRNSPTDMVKSAVRSTPKQASVLQLGAGKASPTLHTRLSFGQHERESAKVELTKSSSKTTKMIATAARTLSAPEANLNTGLPHPKAGLSSLMAAHKNTTGSKNQKTGKVTVTQQLKPLTHSDIYQAQVKDQTRKDHKALTANEEPVFNITTPKAEVLDKPSPEPTGSLGNTLRNPIPSVSLSTAEKTRQRLATRPKLSTLARRDKAGASASISGRGVGKILTASTPGTPVRSPYPATSPQHRQTYSMKSSSPDSVKNQNSSESVEFIGVHRRVRRQDFFSPKQANFLGEECPVEATTTQRIATSGHNLQQLLDKITQRSCQLQAAKKVDTNGASGEIMAVRHAGMTQNAIAHNASSFFCSTQRGMSWQVEESNNDVEQVKENSSVLTSGEIVATGATSLDLSLGLTTAAHDASRLTTQVSLVNHTNEKTESNKTQNREPNSTSTTEKSADTGKFQGALSAAGVDKTQSVCGYLKLQGQEPQTSIQDKPNRELSGNTNVQLLSSTQHIAVKIPILQQAEPCRRLALATTKTSVASFGILNQIEELSDVSERTRETTTTCKADCTSQGTRTEMGLSGEGTTRPVELLIARETPISQGIDAFQDVSTDSSTSLVGQSSTNRMPGSSGYDTLEAQSPSSGSFLHNLKLFKPCPAVTDLGVARHLTSPGVPLSDLLLLPLVSHAHVPCSHLDRKSFSLVSTGSAWKEPLMDAIPEEADSESGFDTLHKDKVDASSDFKPKEEIDMDTASIYNQVFEGIVTQRAALDSRFTSTDRGDKLAHEVQGLAGNFKESGRSKHRHRSSMLDPRPVNAEINLLASSAKKDECVHSEQNSGTLVNQTAAPFRLEVTSTNPSENILQAMVKARDNFDLLLKEAVSSRVAVCWTQEGTPKISTSDSWPETHESWLDNRTLSATSNQTDPELLGATSPRGQNSLGGDQKFTGKVSWSDPENRRLSCVEVLPEGLRADMGISSLENGNTTMLASDKDIVWNAHCNKSIPLDQQRPLSVSANESLVVPRAGVSLKQLACKADDLAAREVGTVGRDQVETDETRGWLKATSHWQSKEPSGQAVQDEIQPFFQEQRPEIFLRSHATEVIQLQTTSGEEDGKPHCHSDRPPMVVKRHLVGKPPPAQIHPPKHATFFSALDESPSKYYAEERLVTASWSVQTAQPLHTPQRVHTPQLLHNSQDVKASRDIDTPQPVCLHHPELVKICQPGINTQASNVTSDLIFQHLFDRLKKLIVSEATDGTFNLPGLAVNSGPAAKSGPAEYSSHVANSGPAANLGSAANSGHAVNSGNAVESNNLVNSGDVVKSCHTVNQGPSVNSGHAVNLGHSVNSVYTVIPGHTVKSDHLVNSDHAANSDYAVSSGHTLNSGHAVNSDQAINSGHAVTSDHQSSYYEPEDHKGNDFVEENRASHKETTESACLFVGPGIIELDSEREVSKASSKHTCTVVKLDQACTFDAVGKSTSSELQSVSLFSSRCSTSRTSCISETGKGKKSAAESTPIRPAHIVNPATRSEEGLHLKNISKKRSSSLNSACRTSEQSFTDDLETLLNKELRQGILLTGIRSRTETNRLFSSLADRSRRGKVQRRTEKPAVPTGSSHLGRYQHFLRENDGSLLATSPSTSSFTLGSNSDTTIRPLTPGRFAKLEKFLQKAEETNKNENEAEMIGIVSKVPSVGAACDYYDAELPRNLSAIVLKTEASKKATESVAVCNESREVYVRAKGVRSKSLDSPQVKRTDPARSSTAFYALDVETRQCNFTQNNELISTTSRLQRTPRIPTEVESRDIARSTPRETINSIITLASPKRTNSSKTSRISDIAGDLHNTNSRSEENTSILPAGNLFRSSASNSPRKHTRFLDTGSNQQSPCTSTKLAQAPACDTISSSGSSSIVLSWIGSDLGDIEEMASPVEPGSLNDTYRLDAPFWCRSPIKPGLVSREEQYRNTGVTRTEDEDSPSLYESAPLVDELRPLTASPGETETETCDRNNRNCFRSSRASKELHGQKLTIHHGTSPRLGPRETTHLVRRARKGCSCDDASPEMTGTPLCTSSYTKCSHLSDKETSPEETLPWPSQLSTPWNPKNDEIHFQQPSYFNALRRDPKWNPSFVIKEDTVIPDNSLAEDGMGAHSTYSSAVSEKLTTSITATSFVDNSQSPCSTPLEGYEDPSSVASTEEGVPKPIPNPRKNTDRYDALHSKFKPTASHVTGSSQSLLKRAKPDARSSTNRSGQAKPSNSRGQSISSVGSKHPITKYTSPKSGRSLNSKTIKERQGINSRGSYAKNAVLKSADSKECNPRKHSSSKNQSEPANETLQNEYDNSRGPVISHPEVQEFTSESLAILATTISKAASPVQSVSKLATDHHKIKMKLSLEEHLCSTADVDQSASFRSDVIQPASENGTSKSTSSHTSLNWYKPQSLPSSTSVNTGQLNTPGQTKSLRTLAPPSERDCPPCRENSRDHVDKIAPAQKAASDANCTQRTPSFSPRNMPSRLNRSKPGKTGDGPTQSTSNADATENPSSEKVPEASSTSSVNIDQSVQKAIRRFQDSGMPKPTRVSLAQSSSAAANRTSASSSSRTSASSELAREAKKPRASSDTRTPTVHSRNMTFSLTKPVAASSNKRLGGSNPPVWSKRSQSGSSVKAAASRLSRETTQAGSNNSPAKVETAARTQETSSAVDSIPRPVIARQTLEAPATSQPENPIKDQVETSPSRGTKRVSRLVQLFEKKCS